MCLIYLVPLSVCAWRGKWCWRDSSVLSHVIIICAIIILLLCAREVVNYSHRKSDGEVQDNKQIFILTGQWTCLSQNTNDNWWDIIIRIDVSQRKFQDQGQGLRYLDGRFRSECVKLKVESSVEQGRGITQHSPVWWTTVTAFALNVLFIPYTKEIQSSIHQSVSSGG